MIKDYLKYFSLKNKKAVVIGGSGLLGSEIIKALISASAQVINLDIKKLKLSSKFNKYQYNFFNVKKMNSLDKNFDKIIKKFGCPDIFVNCSYPTSKNWNNSSFKKNKISILRDNVDFHLNSYVWLSYKICEMMKKSNKRGSVIMLSSIYGLLAQNKEIYKNTNMSENMNYSIIKGGINNFAKQLASFYGSYGIRVNSVCPGGIAGHVKGSKKNQNKIFIKNYSKNCPLKRLGKPEEVASSVLFLSSDASSYITGTSFLIDGGWSIV